MTNETEVREDFYKFIRGFYVKHPEYKDSPLWVTGESYCGKYIPHIAIEILL